MIGNNKMTSLFQAIFFEPTLMLKTQFDSLVENLKKPQPNRTCRLTIDCI